MADPKPTRIISDMPVSETVDFNFDADTFHLRRRILTGVVFQEG